MGLKTPFTLFFIFLLPSWFCLQACEKKSDRLVVKTNKLKFPLPKGEVIVLDPVLKGDLATWVVGDDRGHHSQTFTVVPSPFPPWGSPFPNDGFAVRSSVFAVGGGFGDLGRVKKLPIPFHPDPSKLTLFMDASFSVVDPNPFVSESEILAHFYKDGVFLTVRVLGVNQRAGGDTGYEAETRIPTPNPFSGLIYLNLGFLPQPPDQVGITVYSRMHGGSGQAITTLDNIGLVIQQDPQTIQPRKPSQIHFREKWTNQRTRPKGKSRRQLAPFSENQTSEFNRKSR